MEPADVSDYSKKQYWDQRYEKEPTYDWFPSVYPECLSRIVDELWSRFVTSFQQEKKKFQTEIRVLHLGTGNSRLVHDLAAAWYAKRKENAETLFSGSEEDEKNLLHLKQVAIDYSPVVIENMKKGEQPPVGPAVDWLEADIRDLSNIVPKKNMESKENDEKEDVEKKEDCSSSSVLFDVVIDKGTMDAIQADKESDTLEEDIDAMLQETSRVLKNNNNSIFLQITWEVAYFRKHYTLREEYGWKNDEFLSKNLNPDSSGDSLYRILRYVKKSE